MPGAGKSTVGVLLAKATQRGFVDTDLLIQAGQGQSLQTIIETRGGDGFCALEQEHLLRTVFRGQVVATGGSAVYSEPGMLALRDSGVIVFLDAPLELLQERLENWAARGIVIAPGQSLAELFAQRKPLYRRWADLTIRCASKTQQQIAAEIVQRLEAMP
jgi:shikimate kinase